jgi:hypothetical protein
VNRTLTLSLFISSSLALVSPCFGDLVTASGAGSTLATSQDLTADNVSEIQGALSGTDLNDASLFKIFITDAADFSAMTLDAGAFGIPDTVLSLFDSSGVGVYLNDDADPSNPADTFSCLPSADSSNPCANVRGGVGPVSDGVYYLAISRGANYPVDDMGNEIFSLTFSSTDVLGPSSTNPVAGWDQGAFTAPDFDLVDYDIVLTGAGVETPEPAAWPVISGALLLGVLVRRRRSNSSAA